MELNLSTNSLYYLGIAVWLLAALKGVFLDTYYWQLKEYRWDRMLEFLNSPKGRAFIVSPLNLIRALIILLGIYYSFSLALTALALVTIFRLINNFRHHNFLRPKPTFRMLLMLLAIFASEALAIFFAANLALAVLILEVLRPFLVTILMHIVGIPFLILKKYLMAKATKKRLAMPNLKVIGITGSYGKSSTKEFLYQILQHKFKTIKTSKHVNVDIGIAQILLKEVKDSTEVFIVEMGAYKKGEIASSCNIVKPEIGILTGVNEQHLSIFGSIQNTIQAKGELLASLPTNGLAIVNADSPNALESLQKCNNAEKVIKYSSQTKADLYANNIEQKDSSLNFTVHYKDQTTDFSVPIFGEHFVQNLLACVACALELGLALEEISQYAKSCQVLEGSLQIFENSKKIKIIDDSYNSNPDGFISALNSLKNLKAKRNFLVTMGMIELGEKNDELHAQVGQKIAEICDEIYVTSADSFEILKSSIQKTNPNREVTLITDHQDLIRKINDKIQPGDAILFENRLPQSIINQFKKA
ncbi:MAG: UDP-N-acetylmuramoyl-tripeptide--D-alanyl-D-alanine ligase [Patescibacteria group bacterium]